MFVGPQSMTQIDPPTLDLDAGPSDDGPPSLTLDAGASKRQRRPRGLRPARVVRFDDGEIEVLVPRRAPTEGTLTVWVDNRVGTAMQDVTLASDSSVDSVVDELQGIVVLAKSGD